MRNSFLTLMIAGSLFAANTLNVASTAKIEGNLKTNSLSIDLGAEVAGSISRIS